jgi:hypothetical protein
MAIATLLSVGDVPANGDSSRGARFVHDDGAVREHHPLGGGVRGLVDTVEFGPAVFRNNVRYVGISISPVVTLVFAMLYTSYERLVTLRNLVALFAVPALTNVLIWTNPAHRLWGVYEYVPREEALVQLVVTPGPWIGVHSLYSFAVSIAAIALFARWWLETDRDGLVTRSSTFLVATVLPMLGSAVTLAGLTPVDVTPIVFSITTVLIVVAVFEL